MFIITSAVINHVKILKRTQFYNKVGSSKTTHNKTKTYFYNKVGSSKTMEKQLIRKSAVVKPTKNLIL